MQVEAMEYITAREAAAILKKTVFTVRRYIKEGKLRAYRVGNSYRLLESDIREFVEGKDAG